MNQFVFVEITDSTNTLARAYANDGVAHGFTVVAGQQTAGRGRLGKQWFSMSPLGLYCTVVLRPKLPIDEYARVTFAAGLAVCRVIEELLPEVCISLKWPNDLYITGKKCGGILVEGSAQPLHGLPTYVLVGIGLNVNQSMSVLPDSLSLHATSLCIETGKLLPLEHLAREIRSRLLHEVFRLESGSFRSILEEWRLRDMMQGKWMKWVTTAGCVVYGKSLGINDGGELLVQDGTGKVHQVISGDISLAVK